MVICENYWQASLEIFLRLLIWILYEIFDHASPFIRHLQPEELWLYKFPVTPSYVPTNTMWVMILFFPLIICALDYKINKSKEEAKAAFFTLTLAYPLNGLLTSLLKVLIGRPRPDFYLKCFPNGSGDDFTKCTGISELYLDGRKSCPSGHSSFAFTCMVFITLYTARKLRPFDDHQKYQSCKLCICLLPILIATSIAISRTCDYHHHYEDVIAGSLLGTLVSGMCFKLYFPLSEQHEI